MLRKIIALFFLSIFISHGVLPVIIALVDEEVDITFLMDINEEESKEKESSKDTEIKILDLNNANLAFDDRSLVTFEGYYFKSYVTPHLNLISPPPELHIL